jgi:hypothetical protein
LFLSSSALTTAVAADENAKVQVVASLINAKDNGDGTFEIPFSLQLSNKVQKEENVNVVVFVNNAQTNETEEIITGLNVRNGVLTFSATISPKTSYSFQFEVDNQILKGEYHSPLLDEIEDAIEGDPHSVRDFIEDSIEFVTENVSGIFNWIIAAVGLTVFGVILAIFRNFVVVKRANS